MTYFALPSVLFSCFNKYKLQLNGYFGKRDREQRFLAILFFDSSSCLLCNIMFRSSSVEGHQLKKNG